MSINTLNAASSLEELINKCGFDKNMFNCHPHQMKKQYVSSFMLILAQSVLAGKIENFSIEWTGYSQIRGQIKFKDSNDPEILLLELS